MLVSHKMVCCVCFNQMRAKMAPTSDTGLRLSDYPLIRCSREVVMWIGWWYLYLHTYLQWALVPNFWRRTERAMYKPILRITVPKLVLPSEICQYIKY